MKKPKSKKKTQKYGRPARVTCRALILLDTKKIRAEYLKVYKRNKKKLEKLESDLITFHECDEPEFQKFMAVRFGAERSQQRELSEKAQQAQHRYETICFLAEKTGLRPNQYCALIEKMVTPELDFWAILDQKISEFKQKQNHHEFNDDNDENIDDFDDEEDGGFGDCDNEDEDEDDDGDFREAFRSFFGSIFDDFLPGNKKISGTEHKDLKKLYRELCLRYHPDKSGVHDAKTKCLWVSIQEAYHNKDLVKLRAIHAGIEINSGKNELAISDIQVLINEIQNSIQTTQYELQDKKRSPLWRFSKWPLKKRQQKEREIAVSLQYDLKKLERILRQTEIQLMLIRQPEKPKPAPKPRPKSRKQLLREEAAMKTPDLFAMDF